MKDGPKRVLSQSMEQPWKASGAALTVEDAASTSTLLSSPKAPLRSMSHGNFRATSSSSMSVGSPAPTKRTISVVEEMETKQRENMNRKLKDLQLIAGSRSPQPKVEMPTIVDSRLAKTSALSRSTLRRDSVANYQAVTPAAFSLKATSPATPRFSLGGPELFPLRASHSLTSLNRVYDRGLSVFVSDDYDSYSTTGKGPTENRSATGNVLPRTSLSSSVPVEYLADVPLAREIKATEEKVVENAIDNIFKAISHTGDDVDAQYTSDYKQRSKQDGSLTSGINPAAAGPPLNLKTYPKPQIPTKPAALKAFTSNGEKVTILNGGNAELPNDYNQILGDFNHSSVGVAKDPSVDQQFLEPQDKTGHLARNYNTPDLYRRNQNDANRPDTRSVPQPPKASFNARLHSDLVLPYASDPEVSEFTTSATSSRLGVVSGSRISLQSTNATPCFISHQKMDSLLSDSNTVDSGLGRSEAAGSPGSHYQDSADELDSKGYTGWTAEFSNEGKNNKQQPKRLTKKEFVSTAVISLSTPVTETSKVNYIEIKPTVKDNKIGSTRQSYHQETPFSATSLRGTPHETSDDVQRTQRLSSVPSRYPYSHSSSSSSYISPTTPNQPTSGSIALDSKVPAVDAETSRPIRVSGKKNHREEGVFVPGFDVQSNQKSHSEHKKKTTTSNFETNSSESPYTSGSRHHARSQRESDATEVKRRAEDQSLQRDLHESETRVGDEPQRSRIRSKLFDDFADGRKETRTEVIQSSASNRTNQDKFFNEPLRTRTRNDVREIPEVRNESKLFHDQRRADARTEVRQTHEIKDELYVSRDPQFVVERTQIRQTHTNSVGFEARHQSNVTKKDEETVIQGDDGMVEIEVQLIKGLTGLGFCIEGGIDSPVGDKPITVKRLFKGESAAKGKLQPGDIIVAINGKPMSNKSHYQAWNQLKSIPEGPINLAIRRRRPLPAGTLV